MNRFHSTTDRENSALPRIAETNRVEPSEGSS